MALSLKGRIANSPPPKSAKEAFELVRSIIAMGEIEVEEQFNGNGAPGDFLQYLMGVKVNNYDSPDYKDWEVKFHGGSSYLTLLHKDPSPSGILYPMVANFGWDAKPDKEGIINTSFRHTIKNGKSPRGFVIEKQNDKILVNNINGVDCVPFWEYNVILTQIASKLRRLILVSGTYNKKKRVVKYKTAIAFWDLKAIDVIDMVHQGMIYIDFDCRTSKGRGTTLRNHGTKFRLVLPTLDNLYSSSQVIYPLASTGQQAITF